MNDRLSEAQLYARPAKLSPRDTGLPERLTAAERIFFLEHIGQDFVRQLRGHPAPVPVTAQHGANHAGQEQEQPA